MIAMWQEGRGNVPDWADEDVMIGKALPPLEV